MKRLIYILSVLGFLFNQAQPLKEGIWNGNFVFSNVRPPFSFEVKNVDGRPPVITLLNGKDRQVINNAVIDGDSIFIPLNPFDASLRAKFSDTEMKGTWKKNYQKGKVDFQANYGGMRFEKPDISGATLANKWAIEFKPGTADKYPAVGLFEQEGTDVTGTIITEVGDFRFFEGIVEGDSIKMSSFDGVHAFMIAGVKTGEGWNGSFYFNKNYLEKWVASPDPEAAIENPFEMVTIDEIKHKPYFDLLGAGSGKNAIDVTKFAGKVVIIQVFGTWCPNSLDQTRFLVDWYKTKSDKVEIVGTTYEPNYSQEYGLKRIADYTANLGIPYDIYLGGRMNKSQPAYSFPFIEKINAFPTLVILDKNGFARYVHSYFTGPATGAYFEVFKTRLNEQIDELLAE